MRFPVDPVVPEGVGVVRPGEKTVGGWMLFVVQRVETINPANKPGLGCLVFPSVVLR